MGGGGVGGEGSEDGVRAGHGGRKVGDEGGLGRVFSATMRDLEYDSQAIHRALERQGGGERSVCGIDRGSLCGSWSGQAGGITAVWTRGG